MGIQYTRMRQNNANPYSAPFRRVTSKKVSYNDPIRGYSVYPGGVTPKEEHKYIKLGQSVITLVEDDMSKFENNFMKHIKQESRKGMGSPSK